MSLTRRLFSAAAMTAVLALSACGNSEAPVDGQSSFERAGDRGLGSATAPVTMIEYASVACGHCATFHNEVWPMLESEYIETGKVRFVLREMITGPAQFAIAGFSLAHCVPEERYYDMVDLLFQQQNAIFQAAQTQGSARSQYLAIARSMGMSEADFTQCLSDETITQDILDANDRAGAEGITGTPRFIFNGELLDSRRAPGESAYTYFLGNRQLIIDGEPVPNFSDAETFRRILDHLVAENSGETAMAEEMPAETSEAGDE
ncbi:thioredoxin domain-containing protein [Maricaulis maris]|uniref:Thioredoxin-like protein n=1 Tax=Maricaulis maris TaxID=74318 RepID=A0A495DDS9_9PROT|nr:thioredoxin domain-containing protein [Maricaulis maris]RKR00423.1 thioredoxin-like protein [Maricaulis maris]